MNRTVLTIDQGNTSCKTSVFRGEEFVATHRFDTLSIEELLPLIEEHNVQGVIYCTVAHHDVRMIETLRNLVDGDVIVLSASTPLPIEVDYEPRQALGLDRVAAAVAAAHDFPNDRVLVVDAGTAITLDMVVAGRFAGGRISPGISLRFRALHHFTDRLPLVNHGNDFTPLGNSTEESIRSGVNCGVISEITDAGRVLACSLILLTGGDAPFLARHIGSLPSEINVDPNLVARGLNYIYLYNETF